MSKKYYISGGSRFGEDYVLDRAGFTRVNTMEACDFVVFTGGADINPNIYGEEAHPQTYYNEDRDTRELNDYEKAVALGKGFLGICRGAQLLNSLFGGSLFQHIQHPGFHELVTEEGEVFFSNSVHHQMMRVTDDAIIKAWARNLSPVHEFMSEGQIVNIEDVEKEPEIVVYPAQRAVLVQGHPEFNANDPELARFREYVFNLIKEYV